MVALTQIKSVQQHYSSLSAFCCGNETNRQRRFLMDRRIILIAANQPSGLCVMVVWQFVEALSLGLHQWTFHLVINAENVWTLTVLSRLPISPLLGKKEMFRICAHVLCCAVKISVLSWLSLWSWFRTLAVSIVSDLVSSKQTWYGVS